MKIIIDAMGGDKAPDEIVRGALNAAEAYGVDVILVGRGEDILSTLKKQGISDIPAHVTISHADDVIEMTDSPANVVKEKPKSSLVSSIEKLAAGDGDAVVSAGSTGALLTAATLYVKRVKGIRRAALAPFLPARKGSPLLIDCGANVECTPEYLLQFAFMGSFYAKRQLSLESPRVGLLNIGAEETKGAPLQKQAYQLLQKAGDSGRLNFIGNVESRDVAFGDVDVVVADGYSGNILLKTMEGVGMFFASMLKDMFTKNMGTKLASLLVKDGLTRFKKTLDYSEVGGTPLLGLQKPVIKAHGSSNALAIQNAVRQAIEFAGSGVIADIEKNIDYMKVDVSEE